MDQLITDLQAAVVRLQALKREMRAESGFNGILPLLDKDIKMGSRGGMYYVNSSGKKVYLSKTAKLACTGSTLLFGNERRCKELKKPY